MGEEEERRTKKKTREKREKNQISYCRSERAWRATQARTTQTAPFGLVGGMIGGLRWDRSKQKRGRERERERERERKQSSDQMGTSRGRLSEGCPQRGIENRQQSRHK